jgi:membrane AbrB-like protein
VILGVMLGAAFHPEILAGIGAWVPTMLGVLLYVSVTGAACAFFLYRFAGLDVATAYFAGMPGGLAEMVIQSEEQGGDTRAVALIHSFRIFLVVLTLPLLVQMVGHVTIGPRTGSGISYLEVPPSGYLWLALTGAAGAALGYVLRMPARYLLGPLLVSAAVHLLGWSDFRPPTELINLAQIVMGTVIGCRFIGGSIQMIAKFAAAGVATTVFLMLATFALAAALAPYTDFPMIALLLCYAPGGLAEMSLIALALGIEVPFVAAHHIARLLLVMAGAGAVFRRINQG